MNDLVLINNQGRDVTTSLIVAKVFEKNHADVLRDIRNLHCSADFRLCNFAELFIIKELPNNGTRKDPYYEMTKDGFSFLVMGYTGEKAAQFKERFICEFNKREALLKDDDYIINRAITVLTNRTKALEQTVRLKNDQLLLQEHIIETQAPKVDYYDDVLQSTSAITTNVIAKELGLSARSLNKLLAKHHIIYKCGKTWVLYAEYVNKGYTKTRTHVFTDEFGRKHTHVHTYWTEKGRQFIHEFVKTIKMAA